MGAVRSGSFLLTILLVLYPLGAFSEIIKPTTAMFSDAHADVNADISGTLEKEWKHEFSMATPSPDALTSDAAAEIAMDALLSRNAVIERNPQNPDHYDFCFWKWRIALFLTWRTMLRSAGEVRLPMRGLLLFSLRIRPFMSGP